jgi:hypothetical protein
MSRRFSASNDEVRFPIQAGSNFTGAWSVAVLLKLASATNQWQAVIGHHDSSGAYQAGFEISGQPNPQDHVVAAFDAAATTYGTTRVQSSDAWAVVGVSRAAGASTTARAHIFKGGSWTHENMTTTTLTNGASQTGGSIRLGELADVDDLDGWIAADAGWASDIGDAGFVALTTNLKIADWVAHAATPAYVHQHNQATSSEDILDLMGNGHVATGTISGVTDAVGIAGTTMDTGNEPTGWTYYGASVAAVFALDPQIQWTDDFGPGEDFGPNPFMDDMQPVLTAFQVYTLTLTATAGSTATIIRQANAIRAATSTAVPSITRQVNAIRAAASPGVAAVVKQPRRILAVSSTGVASIATTKVTLLTLSVSSAAVATLTTVGSYFRTLVATSVAALVLRRAVNKTVSVSSASSASVNTVTIPAGGGSGTPNQLPTKGAG